MSRPQGKTPQKSGVVRPMLGGMNLSNQPLYTQFRHNAKAAVAFLRERGSGVAVAALFHPEVGDIDLVWGETSEDARNKGAGLAKIIRWHPEVMHDLQGFISGLVVHQRHRNVIHLRDAHGGRAGIKLERDGVRGHWLVTAFVKGNKAVLVDSLAANQFTAWPDSATHTNGDAHALKGSPAALSDASGLIPAPPDNVSNFILGFEPPSVNEDDVMQTPLIAYNLKERGRKYRGVERNFNIPKIVEAVNAPACQERVSSRDMVGFYGHWPRVKFGMNPAEGGIADGKAQAVEPALVTTHLVAHNDGTIEHKAEFLPTQSGELAYKLFKARTGGFSSAIDTVKPEFFGFDYVLEPNYTTNRGYSLDSVLCEGGMCGLSCCDVDAAILEEQQAGMMALLDSVAQNYDSVAAVLDALKRENAALKKTLNRKAAAEVIRNRIKPSRERAERMTLDAAEFRAARLPLPGELAAVIQKVSDEELAYQRMVSRLTGGRYHV